MAAIEKIARDNRIFNIIYIVLIIILTVLAISVPILTYRFEYMAGTRNDAESSTVIFFEVSLIFFLVMVPIAGCTSIGALISLVLQHCTIGQILLKLMMILLGPVICFFSFENTAPLSPVFLKGFEQWILQEVDVDTIQTWLVSEGAKHAGKNYSYSEGLPEELPECLVKLNAKYILFSDSSSQNMPKMEITWFLFMDEYGLIVGPPSMETPEEEHIELKTGDYEFRRPVKPGAYLFIRG